MMDFELSKYLSRLEWVKKRPSYPITAEPMATNFFRKITNLKHATFFILFIIQPYHNQICLKLLSYRRLISTN